MRTLSIKEIDILESERIYENLPGGYHRFLMDEGYQLLYVNQRFLDLLGWTREDISVKFGNRLSNLIHPNDCDILTEALRKAVNNESGNSNIDVTYRLKCRDGYRYFADALMNISDEGDSYFQGTLTDITSNLLLMDMMMPVMDGITATKVIRSLDHPEANTIPIIAMTANAFKEDELKCLRAGMNAHLAKPLDIDKVKIALNKFLKIK